MKKKLIGYEAIVLDSYVNNMKLVPIVRKPGVSSFHALMSRRFHGVFTDQFIAFVRTHPNLVLLWYKGRNFRAITDDCRLAASINFIRAHLGRRKLDSFGRAGVELVFLI